MLHFSPNGGFRGCERSTLNFVPLLIAALVPLVFPASSTAAPARTATEPNAAKARTPVTQMIDMSGYKLRVHTAGHSRANVPTVIFESGLGESLENWQDVQRNIARDAMTFSYDRAGIGKSEPDHQTPTIVHIVTTLHKLLAKAKIPPPYVLVGHSSGGPAVRLYAARYPDDVAGLVFVDPSDWMDTVAEQKKVWSELRVPNGYQKFYNFRKQFARNPELSPSIRAELEAMTAERRAGFPTFRNLPPLHDVPVVILLAGKMERWNPPDFPGGDTGTWFKAKLTQRIAHMSRVASQSRRGTLIVTYSSTHFIQESEPELVTWAIRRVLNRVVALQDN